MFLSAASHQLIQATYSVLTRLSSAKLYNVLMQGSTAAPPATDAENTTTTASSPMAEVITVTKEQVRRAICSVHEHTGVLLDASGALSVAGYQGGAFGSERSVCVIDRPLRQLCRLSRQFAQTCTLYIHAARLRTLATLLAGMSFCTLVELRYNGADCAVVVLRKEGFDADYYASNLRELGYKVSDLTGCALTCADVIRFERAEGKLEVYRVACDEGRLLKLAAEVVLERVSFCEDTAVVVCKEGAMADVQGATRVNVDVDVLGVGSAVGGKDEEFSFVARTEDKNNNNNNNGSGGGSGGGTDANVAEGTNEAGQDADNGQESAVGEEGTQEVVVVQEGVVGEVVQEEAGEGVDMDGEMAGRREAEDQVGDEGTIGTMQMQVSSHEHAAPGGGNSRVAAQSNGVLQMQVVSADVAPVEDAVMTEVQTEVETKNEGENVETETVDAQTVVQEVAAEEDGGVVQEGVVQEGVGEEEEGVVERSFELDELEIVEQQAEEEEEEEEEEEGGEHVC